MINNYEEPKNISKVAGIPIDWNKSLYNKKSQALIALSSLCKKLNSSYILISYNSEGFISYEEMIKMLKELGDIKVFDAKYNVFKGCRNLSERDVYVKEYLFLLKKKELFL